MSTVADWREHWRNRAAKTIFALQIGLLQRSFLNRVCVPGLV
jgi:hypothetical protein